ncbi:MAG: hypothetical protein ACO277_09620 [Ilumatobacteraceae bacterium]
MGSDGTSVPGTVVADAAVPTVVVVRDAPPPPVTPEAGAMVVVTDTAPAGRVVVVAWDTREVVVVATVVVDADTVVVEAVVLIVTEEAVAPLDGPVLEAASRTVLDPSLAMTVPSEVHVTETVIEVDVDAADGVNTQPVALPRLEKSPDAIPVTDSEKVSV